MRSDKRGGLRKSYLILGCCAFIALMALAYHGGRWLEKRAEKPEIRGTYVPSGTAEEDFTYQGVAYQKRRLLTTILLIGIDQESAQTVTAYRNGGQADFLRLLVIDGQQKKVTQLAIDRDTMTPITILGVLGNRSGMRTAQISLSHGFGDGQEQSGRLTVEAVSNLLCDAPIDFFMALNMSGIGALNDLLGGVTVTLEEDFSHLDAAMTKGKTLTLTAEQAELYVRSRMSMSVGTNEARMARQANYISQAALLLRARQSKNADFVGNLYDAMQPYLVTDMSRARLVNEMFTAMDYELSEVLTLPGTHTLGTDGFMQFWPDEEALQQTAISLFYEPINSR